MANLVNLFQIHQTRQKEPKGEKQMREAVIVSTARTPIGKAYRGAFNNTHGAVLGAHAIKHAIDKANICLLYTSPSPRD